MDGAHVPFCGATMRSGLVGVPDNGVVAVQTRTRGYTCTEYVAARGIDGGMYYVAARLVGTDRE